MHDNRADHRRRRHGTASAARAVDLGGRHNRRPRLLDHALDVDDDQPAVAHLRQSMVRGGPCHRATASRGRRRRRGRRRARPRPTSRSAGRPRRPPALSTVERDRSKPIPLDAPASGRSGAGLDRCTGPSMTSMSLEEAPHVWVPYGFRADCAAALIVLGLRHRLRHSVALPPRRRQPVAPEPTSDRPGPPAQLDPDAAASSSSGGSSRWTSRAIAEAILIEEGIVAAVGTRDEVLALGGEAVPIIDIGENVAYPGFIDAHAHWIGDRDVLRDRHTGRRPWTPPSAAAGPRSPSSGSTRSVSTSSRCLAVETPCRPRRRLPCPELRQGVRFGDWYTDARARRRRDRLHVQGLKIHLDDGSGNVINWDPADLTATIVRADVAGWQISVHAMSTAALDLVLDAFEAALGATGPNRSTTGSSTRSR